MEQRFSKEAPRPNTVFALFDKDLNTYMKTRILPNTGNGQPIGDTLSLPFPKEVSFHPLKHYFDFTFHVCMSPFRFVKEGPNQYGISTSATRKASNFITFALSMLYYITTARKRFAETQQTSVINYFYFVHSFFHCAMLGCFYRAVSTKSQEFLKLMNGFGITSLVQCGSRKTQTISLLFHFLYIGAFLFLLLFDWIALLVDDWTMKKVVYKGMLFSRYALFIDSNSNFTLNNVGHSGPAFLIFLDYILGIFGLILVIFYSLMNAFQTFAFIHCPISLWIAIKNFLKEVLVDDSQFEKDASLQISHKFGQLLKLSDFINSAWGLFYFVSLLDSVAWLATDLDAGLKTNDLTTKGSAAWHFVSIMMFLVVSAECARKMASFKIWLIQHGKRVFTDDNELSDLINIADSNTVGIGIDGLYRIDYPFTGQITTIIITFFIITLQYDRKVDDFA